MAIITRKPTDVKPDKSLNQEVERLTKYKKGAMVLAYTYEKTDLPWRIQWSKMLKYCGNRIIYAQDPDTGKWGIAVALFCQKRLCPLCSWRRSVRISRNVYQIVTAEEFKDVRFIFLTLTIKNCTGEELSETLDRLLSAWYVLTRDKRQPFRKSFLGTLRSLEITYNRKTKTYHPHFHVLAAVHKGYFKKSNADYISHDALREIWINALNRAVKSIETIRQLDLDTFGARLNLGSTTAIARKVREKYPPIDYAPQVRIEKIRNSTGKVIAEMSKYAVKPADYIDLPEVVQVLDPALRHRRLIAYGGLFAETRERLKLEDEQIAEEDYKPITVAEMLKNPLVLKMMTNWTFQGAYKITPYSPGAEKEIDILIKQAQIR